MTRCKCDKPGAGMSDPALARNPGRNKDSSSRSAAAGIWWRSTVTSRGNSDQVQLGPGWRGLSQCRSNLYKQLLDHLLRYFQDHASGPAPFRPGPAPAFSSETPAGFQEREFNRLVRLACTNHAVEGMIRTAIAATKLTRVLSKGPSTILYGACCWRDIWLDSCTV